MDGHASRVAGDGTKLAVLGDMEVVLQRAEDGTATCIRTREIV
jgi:hypothetical protein